MEETERMKTLNVGVVCQAYYRSQVNVPARMSLEEAVGYAKEHVKDLPIMGGLEYIDDSDEIDEEQCCFIPVRAHKERTCG